MKYTESGGGYDLTLRYTYDTKGNLTYLAETVAGLRKEGKRFA